MDRSNSGAAKREQEQQIIYVQETVISAQATAQALTHDATKNDTAPLSQYMQQKPIYTSSSSDYSWSVYSYTLGPQTYHNSVYASSNDYYSLRNGACHLS